MSTVTHMRDPQTWPIHVSQRLGLDDMIPSRTKIAYARSCHTGSVGQGNGLISRHIIYQVNHALKTIAPEDLLVGVVWSGPSRFEFYQDPIDADHDNFIVNVTGLQRNQWRILNHHWSDRYSESWYRNFYSHVGSLVASYEHMLRTQWFLQQRRVKYFMSAINQEVIPADMHDHKELAHLHDMIDFTRWLPISGVYEWALQESGLPFDMHDLCHLTTDQNIKLTDEVIMPFLERASYV